MNNKKFIFLGLLILFSISFVSADGYFNQSQPIGNIAEINTDYVQLGNQTGFYDATCSMHANITGYMNPVFPYNYLIHVGGTTKCCGVPGQIQNVFFSGPNPNGDIPNWNLIITDQYNESEVIFSCAYSSGGNSYYTLDNISGNFSVTLAQCVFLNYSAYKNQTTPIRLMINRRPSVDNIGRTMFLNFSISNLSINAAYGFGGYGYSIFNPPNSTHILDTTHLSLGCNYNVTVNITNPNVLNISVNVKNIEKVNLPNATVKLVYCEDLTAFGQSPFCTGGFICSHGNQLSAYRANYPSCGIIQSGLTDSNGNALFQLGFYDITPEIVIGASLLPYYDEVDVYDLLANSLMDNPITFNLINRQYNITLEPTGITSNLTGVLKTWHFHVTDKDTGLPINNSYVKFVAGDGTIRSGYTDKSGWYNFSRASCSHYAYTIIKDPDYYPIPSTEEIVDLSRLDIVIEVEMVPIYSNVSFNVSGNVSNASWSPIYGCTVNLDCVYPQRASQEGALAIPFISIHNSILTNSKGYYHFDSLRNGTKCTLLTLCDGYSNQQVDFDVFTNMVFNFNLTKSAASLTRYRITGRVTDGFNGLADATVELSSKDRTYSSKTTTDSNGMYSINNFISGNTNLYVSKNGYNTYSEEKEILSNTVWNAQLTKISTPKWLRGKCVKIDSDLGETPVNCTVQVRDPNMNIVTQFKSSPTQVGYFSSQISSGIYTVSATYKLNTLSQGLYLYEDMSFDTLTFKFSDALTAFSLKIDELVAFMVQLFDFIKIIFLLFLLAIISMLVSVITGSAGMYGYQKKRR